MTWLLNKLRQERNKKKETTDGELVSESIPEPAEEYTPATDAPAETQASELRNDHSDHKRKTIKKRTRHRKARAADRPAVSGKEDELGDS